MSSGWSQTKHLGFRLPAVGRYTFRYFVHMGPTDERVKKMFNAPEEHWIGEVSSELLTVVVKEPEGLDAEAFQAVCALAPEKLVTKIPPAECYRMVWHPRNPTGARQLLFSKYLGSTYASYEIYRHFFNQYGFRSADFFQRASTPEGLVRIEGYTWCNAHLQPEPAKESRVSLTGEDYIRCRRDWLEVALENHPDTWFADDIRLMLAGDAYLLGEKERCRSLIEGLIAKGRPYAASSARGLLDGMVEKGMLPPAPPKSGFTEGEQ